MKVSDWDGRGLPPAAKARLDRFRDDGIRTSLLRVPDAAGLDSVGLTFVGEVMGCMVEQILWTGTGMATGLPATTTFVDGKPVTTRHEGPLVTTSSATGWGGYGPYVQALYAGYRTAVSRMVDEAAAMGAVGVVGVTVRRQKVGQLATEFVATGTAVRDRAGGVVARPFVTDLCGADVAKALSSGWVPVSLAFGISVAVLGGGWAAYRQLARQTRRWSGNTEVVAYSELLGRARADARDQFRADAARAAADAAVVSGMSVEMLRFEGGRGSEVHGAQAIVTGSTMARFHGSASRPTRTLTVVPLRRPAATTGDVS